MKTQYARLVERRTKSGFRYLEQEIPMPIGLNPDFLRITIYLFPSVDAAEHGLGVGGSGFLLGVRSPDGKRIRQYAVTNKHVIDGGNHVIRTTWSGGVDVIKTQPETWTTAVDDDLAVVEFDGPGFNFLYMDEVFLEEDCQIDGWPLFPGDDVFLYGRFITHEGQQRNKPVVRFGNISMMPDPEAPVKVGDSEQIAFLVECRSMSGFSGSPAFVHLTQPRLTEQKGWIGSGLRFLGVDCAHLSFWSQAQESRNRNAAKIPNIFVETNSGIAVVIPAWRLKKLINEDHLVKEREKYFREAEEEAKRRSEAIPDLAD